MTRRKLWIVAAALTGLLAAAGLGLYGALHHVPAFYREALAVDPQRQEAASDDMLNRITVLAGDLQKVGPWQAVFTAQQINGWLAVDMLKNHPDLFPPGVSNPRVQIDGRRVVVACQVHDPRLSAVGSLTLEPYLVRPNVLAVRLVSARAGGLPMPLHRLLEEAGDALNRTGLHVHWQQSGGDPVVIVDLSPPNKPGKQVQIEKLQLADGAIAVAGHTRRN